MINWDATERSVNNADIYELETNICKGDKDKNKLQSERTGKTKRETSMCDRDRERS